MGLSGVAGATGPLVLGKDSVGVDLKLEPSEEGLAGGGRVRPTPRVNEACADPAAQDTLGRRHARSSSGCTM